MILRLLLFFISFSPSVLFSQQDFSFAVSGGFEVSHFATATPGHLAADFHMNGKRSLFSIGYSVPLYQQTFMDDDDITPPLMRIPSLNISYTFKFVQPAGRNQLSLGTTIGYKFGHWRTRGDLDTEAYTGGGVFLDTSIAQVTHVTHVEKWESDQHHFFVGLYGEYPLRKVRLFASLGAGVVFRNSYHFDEETTYYTQGRPTEFRYYNAVTPFAFLSASLYLKLGVMLPFSIFRK